MSDLSLPTTEPAPPERPPREPFWSWEDLLVFVFLALPSLVIAGLVTTWVRLVAPAALPTKAAQQIGAQFLAYGLWFIGLWALLKSKYDRPFWKSLGWRFPAPRFWRWALAGPYLAVGVAVLGAILRTPDIRMPFKDLLSDRSSIILIGVFAVTFGPICEELVFRGFMFPLAARLAGPPVGAVLTALPFALLHGPQYAWSWRHILVVAVAGTAFGWARHRTGSTVASTLMHATYNLTMFAAYFALR